ncbi:Sensor histidine kinase TmoS [Planktothrix tepida]|uniref:histidine kinase n=1 Tax=Planktothrix tepida PCC 9214 TaxID=671072 RepID=A0A1J1LRP4_9CYAN|nr:ATP-binding protein [Planktothrix tepida]CAD5954967.1 Sensor histidine kinase TmoS [Planktothrix tepida]CUR34201.1 PAS/PAC sensor hybrid histidine kinase (modular protein) [Planktothrix tepida PCC 9214]
MNINLSTDSFSGQGEIHQLICTLDWSKTLLGPPSQWPQSLRTAVSIILNSRYPMFIWWGEEYINLYNEAYRPILGTRKHPQFFGQSAKDCWAEVWDVVGLLAESVLHTGQPTWSENLMLIMHRSGYTEETYFTFSYSPITDESGGVGGIFCAVTETTEQIIGERRLQTLREIATATTDAKTVEIACQRAIEAIASNNMDIPFALLYRIQDGKQAYLAGTAGIEPNHPIALSPINLTENSDPWELNLVNQTGETLLLEDLNTRFDSLPMGVWDEPPQAAMVIPLTQKPQSQLAGFLILGISPRRAFDDSYRGFFDLIANQVAIAIANAQAYEAERQRSEALAELNRAKTAFFSNISHEFRTPLTLILGSLEETLLSPNSLNLDQQEQLQVAKRNSLRLLKLVNTLLDFSSLEAERFQAVYEPTDLSRFTTELASMFRSAIERAGMQLIIDCPPLPELIYIDREMWEKIVLNLLSNAFKFTFKGKITVSLRWMGDHVQLNVQDTGIGIRSKDIPHVFERFHRVSEAQGRTYEGSGIGLSLVKELVQLHAGTIEISSIPGEGSCFIVSIPSGCAHLDTDQICQTTRYNSSPLEATAYLEEVMSWENPSCIAPLKPFLSPTSRILLVEDNGDMRNYMQRLLSQHYQVESVHHGLAALEAIHRQKPDLVVSDIMMPELDGFELLHTLRRDPRTQEIPIILLSARAGEEATIEGLEAGADDYLIKPFSARELLARVHSILELTRLRQEATIREQELNTTKAQVIDILESITDGFFALDHQWRFTYINQASERLFLKTRGELLGCNLWEIYPNFLKSIEAQKLHQVMENQEAEHFETSTIHPGFWYEAHVYPYQEGLAVYWRDITERKQAEVSLRQSEERFRVAQELSLDAFTILQSVRDETGKIIDFEWTYVNPKAADVLHQTIEKLIGQRLLEVLPGNKTNSDLFERYVRVVETGEPHDIELCYQSEGIMGWFRNMCVKIGDGVAISFSDISDRKLSEAALLQSEERLRVALKSAPITLFNQDQNLRYTWIYNPFLQQSVDEIIGRSDFDLLPQEQASQLVQLKRQVLETATGAREELCLIIQEQKYYFDLTIEPLRNTEDEIIGVTCSGVNISDHKQVELALRQSEALANARAEELRTFMETVPAAVWVAHDPQCHEMTANRAAHQLVQLPSGSIVTATPEDGSYPFLFTIQHQGVDIPLEELPMQIAGRTGEDVEAEFEFVFENGEVRYIYGRAVPLRDEGGKIRGVIGAFLDISDRKRAEEELREREQRFITLFHGMEDWVLVYHLTPDYQPGTFIEVNQQACNKLGFSREELLTMSVADIVGSSWVYPQANIEQLLQQKRLVVESVHRTKQGHRIPVEVSATLFTLNGLPTVQAICRDITERKQAEQEREKLLTRERAAREEAEVANRIKDEFLAVLSHELRSPLNPILGWTKLLQTRKFDAAGTARALETIERNAKLQTQLIEDLLDISRILRGKMALNMEPVNLISTIQAALETVKLAAEAKGIQVTFEVIPGEGMGVIPLRQVLRSPEALFPESQSFINVLGDKTRLQQVMWNLLSNAIKFTPSGGVVEVQLECREGQAQIQVKDTGKGINSEFLPFVFDYFRQEDSTTTRKFGGLGLGLAIVRHLTELHGGTVSVDSLGEGQGAVFLVQLPLMAYEREQPQSPTIETEEIDLMGLKILVVDDEIDIRDLVEFILEQAGAEVRVANSAREALGLMSEFSPDVLISDIGMPEMDGYGLIAEVRKTSSIPAIALTAYAGETNQALALAAGFQVHLAKPIEPDELVLAIINLTKK